MTEMHPHLHCPDCGFPLDVSDVITVDAIGWTCDLVDGLVVPKQCPNCSKLYRIIRALGVLQLSRIPDCCTRPRLIRRQVHHLTSEGVADGTSRIETLCTSCKETHLIGERGQA